jgi:hypothetical protein
MFNSRELKIDISFARFAVGTLLVERTIKVLGRFHLCSAKRSFVPAVPFVSRLLHTTRSHGSTGHSASQARFLTLILSSVLHMSYFLVMGFRSGYPCLLLAYCLAALARAYLTCGNIFLLNNSRANHCYQLPCGFFDAQLIIK